MIDSYGNTLQPLYIPSLVNRNHPITKDLFSWYLPIPELSGGRIFYDIIGTSNGTLTSMTNTSNGWQTNSRPGSYGSILFDGTAGVVNLGTLASISFIENTLVFTLSMWVKMNSSSARYCLVSSVTSSTEKGFLMTYENGAGVGTQAIRFAAEKGVGGQPVITQRTVDSTITDTNWHHITVTGNGTTCAFYVDGISIALGTTEQAFNGLSSGVSTRQPLLGAASGASLAIIFAGSQDDIAIWNRTLNAKEVKQLYDLSRIGYPDVLTRLHTTLDPTPPFQFSPLIDSSPIPHPHEPFIAIAY